MRVSQILTEKLINVKLNRSTFDITLNCIFDIDLRNLTVLHSNLNLREPVVFLLKSPLYRGPPLNQI